MSGTDSKREGTSAESILSCELLSNGVTLINDYRPSADDVAVFLVVRRGSRNETPATAGLAHVLEHLFFDGTSTRSARQISEEFSRLAARSNAFTGVEMVAYHAYAPARLQLSGGRVADTLAPLAAIFSDMVLNSRLDPDEVAGELNIVLQEYASEMEDPEGWLGSAVHRVAWGGDQSLAWDPLGRVEVIRSLDRAHLAAYRDQFYLAGDMALVVSGGDRMGLSQAQELLGQLPSGSSIPSHPAPVLWGQGSAREVDIRSSSSPEEQCSFVVALPGCGWDEPEIYSTVMTAAVLGGSDASRLFQVVRQREKLAYGAYASHDSYQGTGVFMIDAATLPADAPRAVALCSAELRQLAHDGLAAEELELHQRSVYGAAVLSGLTAEQRAEHLAYRWARHQELQSPMAAAAPLLSVTPGEIQEVAGQLVAAIDDGLARLVMVSPVDLSRELELALREPQTVLGRGANRASA